MTGFEKYPTDILLTVRDNLLAGLERVSETIDDGTFLQIGAKGSSPAQSGYLTASLLVAVTDTLDNRAERV
jgi:hypothetical protein